MKPTRLVTVVAALLVAGCGSDPYARRIVQLDTTPGKLDENLVGSSQRMIERGKIDNHEVYRTGDGVDIDVWEIDARTADGSAKLDKPLGTMVVLHCEGYSKASWPFLGAGERLAKMGYDVVLPDLRAHGQSGGKYTTWGVKESDDVKAVVGTLLDAKIIHEPIYAVGMGLGAATAIQYAAKDERCKGVMAMTPFKSLRAYFRPQFALLSDKDFDQTVERAGEIADFDPDDADNVVAAGKMKAALLLTYRLVDAYRPIEASQAICDAAPGPKKLAMVTPPEEAALPLVMEDWVADKANTVASGGFDEKSAE
jgi:pimeloyl-ACP methyl ester carboxylesterase